MEYKKHESISYNPRIVQVSMGNYTVAVNYSEITDESCLEFSHVHTDFEIYYCLEGTMYLMAGESCVEMKENTLTILKPGLFHHTLYEPKNPKRYFIFVFEIPVKSALKTRGESSENMDLYLEKVIQYLNDEQTVTLPDHCGCHQIIQELEREMDQDLPGKEEMIRAFYTQYLIHIFRNLEVSHEVCSSKELADQGNVNLALELTQYMHDNYSRNISVRDAAETFHISERHVGRIFDKYFGKSFKNTLNIYRINYAKNYLLDTDYSIEKIADLVGISSTRKFHQLFREIERMTATEYRAKHKGTNSHYGIPEDRENL